ncbi:hypothetical protein GY45DRAFT_1325309 [Cubamyces sp. BRFM 1775]|nr:hypothetical protein GY45DRAFT_1325309 [Cubamyces sp. BRFM 1775]
MYHAVLDSGANTARKQPDTYYTYLISTLYFTLLTGRIHVTGEIGLTVKALGPRRSEVLDRQVLDGELAKSRKKQKSRR